jgi:hypothetical protein
LQDDSKNTDLWEQLATEGNGLLRVAGERLCEAETRVARLDDRSRRLAAEIGGSIRWALLSGGPDARGRPRRLH